ncbi:MAG TPA: hypothetical protein VGM88_26610 [Kofleriaceae bacterium]|jgi:tetratricopeptide (TPR) repeat protein
MRWIVVAAVLAAAAPVLAQTPSGDAEALFTRGKQLLADGKTAEACDAFQNSQKLAPALTTLVNLATCREKNQQLATAWALFTDAARQLRTPAPSERQMAKTVDEHVAALAPKLSKLTLKVSAQAKGLELRRNEELVDPAAWNVPLPIDGGSYTITAAAPGRASFSKTIAIAISGDAQVVEVPELATAESVAPETRADVLFHEGRALMAKDPVAGCAKMDESAALNPAAIGTVINIAACHQRFGRIASALARFKDVIDLAREKTADNVKYRLEAEKQIAVLTPLVPHLELVFVEPPPAGTQIVVDKRVIAVDAITDITVDPGEREVVVSAPKRLAFHKTIGLGKGVHERLEIPHLQSSTIIVTSSRRRIGQIVGGVGILAGGTGIVMGIVARNRWHSAVDSAHCSMQGDDILCDDYGQHKTDTARTLGNVGTILAISGGVALAAGITLWALAPSSHPHEHLSIAPAVSPDSVGVTAVGRF